MCIGSMYFGEFVNMASLVEHIHCIVKPEKYRENGTIDSNVSGKKGERLYFMQERNGIN